MRPQPVSLFGISAPSGLAVEVRMLSRSSTVSAGSAWRTRAATPATCGEAIDVPLPNPYLPPGRLDRI